jgi:hypothetical protein
MPYLEIGLQLMSENANLYFTEIFSPDKARERMLLTDKTYVLPLKDKI